MLRRSWLLLPAVLATHSLVGQTDSARARAFAYVEAFVREHQREEGTPGIAVALVTRDRLLRVLVVGVADLASQAPLTPETRFQAGSISKAFTATALLQLQEEGLLDVTRPVGDYLPWFSVRSSGGPITLHQLLTHTAGLPRDRSDLPSSPYTAIALRDAALSTAPGVRFTYSNIGYQLLSLIIEEIEGRPFSESIQSRVLDPLELRHTAPAVTQEGRISAATGYRYFYDDRPPAPGYPLVPVPWTENSAGDANILSTPGDLARFLQMLLNQGNWGGRRLLQPSSFARMVQRTVPALELGPNTFYGYGLVLGSEDDDPTLWHSGGMPGYRAMMLGDLDEGLGVVVLMNGPGNPRKVAEYALHALIASRRGKEPPPVPVAADPWTVAAEVADTGDFADSAGVTLRIEREADRLALVWAGVRVPLLRLGRDCYYADHPAFVLFPLCMLRQDQVAVELSYGERWFASTAYRGPRSWSYPPAWRAYPGHYRAQVPYDSNYRVVIRKGGLLLVSPEGYEEPLVPLEGRVFRVGADPTAPERVRFEDLVSGRALRLNLSGTDYYRSTTP